MRRRNKSTGDLNYLGGGHGRESLPRFSSRGVGLQLLQESLASPVAGCVKQKYVALLPISIDIPCCARREPNQSQVVSCYIGRSETGKDPAPMFRDPRGPSQEYPRQGRACVLASRHANSTRNLREGDAKKRPQSQNDEFSQNDIEPCHLETRLVTSCNVNQPHLLSSTRPPAPALANRSARSRPMPPVPPVTT